MLVQAGAQIPQSGHNVSPWVIATIFRLVGHSSVLPLGVDILSKKCLYERGAPSRINEYSWSSVCPQDKQLVYESTSIFTGPAVLPGGEDSQSIEDLHVPLLRLLVFLAGHLLAGGVAEVLVAGAPEGVLGYEFVEDVHGEGTCGLLPTDNLPQDQQAIRRIDACDQTHRSMPSKVPGPIHDTSGVGGKGERGMVGLRELGEDPGPNADPPVDLHLLVPAVGVAVAALGLLEPLVGGGGLVRVGVGDVLVRGRRVVEPDRGEAQGVLAYEEAFDLKSLSCSQVVQTRWL